MSENRNSIFYLIAVGASFFVFVFAGIGLFLPLVTIDGEAVTVYNTVEQIVEFFKDIKNINIDKIIKITKLVRNTIVISLAISLLIRIIISFLKHLVKNLRNVFHPNDFYGEDLISVCIQIAIFSMMMYAYYPKWEYAIGLEFMTIAAVTGIGVVSLLRIVEGLKSDERLKGLGHAILMSLASLSLFTVILVGMHSPVIAVGETARPAIINEFTSYFTYTFTSFSKESIVALICEFIALALLFASFTQIGYAVSFTTGCVRKSRRNRRKHIQKEYHFRAILRSLLGLAFMAGSIAIIIIKSPEAFGRQYTVGRTGIVSGILIVIGIALIVAAKLVKPHINTYERAESKEEAESEKELHEAEERIREGRE